MYESKILDQDEKALFYFLSHLSFVSVDSRGRWARDSCAYSRDRNNVARNMFSLSLGRDSCAYFRDRNNVARNIFSHLS